MAVNVLDANRRVFTNLKSIIFTPWIDETTLGTDSYDLVNIVGDTSTVEQEDNDVNAIEHEFSSEPLYETVTLGKKTFTTECIDFQNDVLGKLMGWEVDESGNAWAPIVYKDLFCKIELQFNSSDDIVVLPKVKMNSKAMLSSMKTDVSRGSISGTCYSAYVKVGDVEHETDEAVVSQASATTYTVSATSTKE
ncbi:MAG: hypothetical protein ACI35S_06750 [Anaeroplasma sp.]